MVKSWLQVIHSKKFLVIGYSLFIHNINLYALYSLRGFNTYQHLHTPNGIHQDRTTGWKQ